MRADRVKGFARRGLGDSGFDGVRELRADRVKGFAPRGLGG